LGEIISFVLNIVFIVLALIGGGLLLGLLFRGYKFLGILINEKKDNKK
jgi:hypothetical protein